MSDKEMKFSGGLKGKLGDFFLFVQSFYRPKTKTSFNRQFSPKSPKMGKKSGQRVQNSQNKDPTVNSGFRPTVGIHLYTRVGRMPLGPYFVNFGPFGLIFDPFWGFSVKIAY